MSKFQVCPRCMGEGRAVNRALSVWTSEDIDADPESFEAMMAGRYDETCDRCNGLRVVTSASERSYRELEQDRRTMLAESGCYEA